MFSDLPPNPPAIETPAQLQATATVRIVKATIAADISWNEQTSRHRREIIVRERDGRLTRVRLIENE